MKILMTLFSLAVFTQLTTAQDTLYSRKIIDSLASSFFHGRGYTNSGALLASEYISKELAANNVEPLFGKSFFQEFRMPVISITGDPLLKIGEKELKPAEDYVIWPNTPPVKGSFYLFRLKPDNIQDLFTTDLSKVFIVVDTLMQKHKDLKELTELIMYSNPFRAKGIIVLTEKTMQVHRSQPSSWTHIELKNGLLPDDAKVISLVVNSEYQKKYTVRNVGGIIKGKSDSVIVFSSHYDHIGEFGKYFFPGANDNASGVSMLLTLARSFKNKKPENTLVFLFVTGEEIGLKGSEYYTEHPAFSLLKIKYLFNLDMVGTGDEGITVVNGSIFKTDFDRMVSLNDTVLIPKIKPRSESRSSDHYNFYKRGVKSFFIYTNGGSQAYHNIYDIPPALSMRSYYGIIKLLLNFTEEEINKN